MLSRVCSSGMGEKPLLYCPGALLLLYTVDLFNGRKEEAGYYAVLHLRFRIMSLVVLKEIS